MDILSSAASFFLITFSVIGILGCLLVFAVFGFFCYLVYREGSMTTALLDRRSLPTGLLATAAGCMHREWEPSPPAAVHLGLAARVTLWDGREFIGPVVEVNDQGFVIEVDGEPRLIRTGEILYLEVR